MLVNTQVPRDTKAMVDTIKSVRGICESYGERGLPNFPHGIFISWEQYIGLGFYLLLALAATIAAVFLLISVLLVSPLAVSVIW